MSHNIHLIKIYDLHVSLFYCGLLGVAVSNTEGQIVYGMEYIQSVLGCRVLENV